MSGWGQGEWPTAHFNEANARRVAEAEAERKSAGSLRSCLWHVLLFSAPIWAVVVLLVWLL